MIAPLAPPSPLKWAFLDRDGTVNVKAPPGEYITAADQLVLEPGAARAIRRLNQAGIRVLIVTNQRGIARRKMSEADFWDVQLALDNALAADGAHVDAVYHCPHWEDDCDCRKPRPGMLLRAQRDNPGLVFNEAILVGDSASDIEAGRRTGTMTVLLRPPAYETQTFHADLVAPSLDAAVDWALSPDVSGRDLPARGDVGSPQARRAR